MRWMRIILGALAGLVIGVAILSQWYTLELKLGRLRMRTSKPGIMMAVWESSSWGVDGGFEDGLERWDFFHLPRITQFGNTSIVGLPWWMFLAAATVGYCLAAWVEHRRKRKGRQGFPVNG